MNKNRIKRMNKTAACGLAIALTLSSNVSPCFAAAQSTQKEENIYATLKSDGTVKGIYVVNSYDLTKDMDIVDYGTYSSVKNLTSEEEIKNEKEMDGRSRDFGCNSGLCAGLQRAKTEDGGRRKNDQRHRRQ